MICQRNTRMQCLLTGWGIRPAGTHPRSIRTLRSRRRLCSRGWGYRRLCLREQQFHQQKGRTLMRSKWCRCMLHPACSREQGPGLPRTDLGHRGRPWTTGPQCSRLHRSVCSSPEGRSTEEPYRSTPQGRGQDHNPFPPPPRFRQEQHTQPWCLPHSRHPCSRHRNNRHNHRGR